MFGNNPIRGLEKGDGSFLLVQHIFPTFQGEGPFVGQPAVFVRLGGCNLACSFCDTEFESFEEQALESVLFQVRELAGEEQGKRVRDLVVITGGEPFRQEIGPLCDRLLAYGFRVQVETNGTLYRPVDARVHIVCSPKVSHGRYHSLRPDVLSRVNALKFIVSQSDNSYNAVPDVGQTCYDVPVYVQPMDEYDVVKNAANRAHAAALSARYGYFLSLQLHKIVGVD